MKIRVAPIFGGLLTCALLACGGDPPKAELDGASTALQAAKAAGAEKYASGQLAAAQAAYDKAEGAYKAEADKLFKEWEAVNPLISDAKGKADQAKSSAAQAKSKAKGSAESAIAAAAASIDAARAGLDAAPAGKGTEGDVDQLRADLDAAGADLSSARSAVGREDFASATSKANGAKSAAEAVAGGVAAATARYHELVEANTPWYMRM